MESFDVSAVLNNSEHAPWMPWTHHRPERFNLHGFLIGVHHGK
jgi:hypothetical protein